MSLLTNPAFGPKVALIYVTTGALIDVWTAVYYFAFGRTKIHDGDPTVNNTWFWVVGFFLTGLVLIILGLVLGPLGRAAREAELPPKDATRKEAQIQQNAAVNPNPVISAAAAGMTPTAAVPMPAPGVTAAVPAPPQPLR
jgi:hypothetical protein